MTRRPRRPAAAMAAGVAGLGVGLAVGVWVWFLIVVPFALVACYAFWLGLSNDELLDVAGTVDDAGVGPAGLTP